LERLGDSARRSGSVPERRERRLRGAVDAAGAGEIAGTGVVGVVAPVALDLPARAVRERDELPAELPGALVRVLGARRVVPRVAVRIGQGLAKLVAADVAECRDTLGVPARGV